ncbi:MAG: isochorismatase hydrolase [Halothiobacillaceae bacterium]|nr:MAG: isochorismatase hydrolase [Halothiobacillaceae bacterium]
MIQLRNLSLNDIVTITQWPTYPADFAELDYALRENGWLNEFLGKPDVWLFAIEQAGELIAFTLLAKTGDAEAEFRIALRADVTGQGLGGTIATATLARGFNDLNLSRIHLIVRKNNRRAIRLYQRLGFTERGTCLKEVNGQEVHFLAMDLRCVGSE